MILGELTGHVGRSIGQLHNHALLLQKICTPQLQASPATQSFPPSNPSTSHEPLRTDSSLTIRKNSAAMTGEWLMGMYLDWKAGRMEVQGRLVVLGVKNAVRGDKGAW